jgi:poly(3-hydroxybutyrate) depolymerase
MSIVATLEATLSKVGPSAIPFVDESGNPDRPLTLHCYRAKGYAPDRPVVLVQHGMMRNGDDYRDFWIPSAERHGLLIIATTFSNEHYPEAASYNNGLVYDASGALRPRERWGYASIHRIFSLLRQAGVTARERAHLFGHSAGGQFVHRLLGTQPHDWLETAIAANSGWYSLPTLDKPFPEGLGGFGLAKADLVRLFAYPLTILAGDQDIDTADPHLPAQEEASRQGPHRFARAHNYLAVGRQEAERLGTPFNWTLTPVPGIGHDGSAMSVAAASLWFEGRLPSVAELSSLSGRRAA